MEQLPVRTQPEYSEVMPKTAVIPPVTDNKFIQKMTTPSNSFIARLMKPQNNTLSVPFVNTARAQESPIQETKKQSFLERLIPGRTINLSKTPEMITNEIHPVAHEIKDREKFNKSIRMVESTDDYSIVRKGNGAMGAYQVMPRMLPLFTKKYFGKEISQKEFISSPQIQDQLFNKFMDEYVPKEGLRNATARWFLGKNYEYAMGSNDKKKILKDGNGLTAEDYWKKVESKYRE